MASAKKSFPGVCAFRDAEDRYGEKYKATVEKKGLCVCYICQCSLSTYSQTCEECEHEFYVCKKHKSDLECLMLGSKCIYCTRLRNDTLSRLLGLIPADAVLTETEKRVIEWVNKDAAS